MGRRIVALLIVLPNLTMAMPHNTFNAPYPESPTTVNQCLHGCNFEQNRAIIICGHLQPAKITKMCLGNIRHQYYRCATACSRKQ